MPKHLWPFAIAVASLIATAASAGAPEVPAGAQPLGDSEIKALLDGRSFSFEAFDEPLVGTSNWNASAGTVSGDYVWNKTDKGVYEVKWFIEDGRSCTQSPDKEPVCQVIYRHGEGFIEVNKDGKLHAVSIPASP